MKQKTSEVTRQFEEIFQEHHNPEKREERKILRNRKKRAEIIKKDLGL